MLVGSAKDIAWSQTNTVAVFEWGSGVVAEQDRMLIGTGAAAAVPRNIKIGQAQLAAFGNPEWPRWSYPVPPITIGRMTRQILMRKKIADGTARPGEIAEFERVARERQAGLDAAAGLTAEHLIANREKIWRWSTANWWRKIRISACPMFLAAPRTRGPPTKRTSGSWARAARRLRPRPPEDIAAATPAWCSDDASYISCRSSA